MITKKNQNKIVNMFMILAIVVVIHLGVDIVVNVTTLRYLQEFEDLDYYYFENEIPLENATAKYLDYVREFYKYNVSNAGKELSKEQLLEQGGVCSHYTKLYIDLAKKDGFNGEYVVFDVGNIYLDEEITAHAVAIISNNKGYCVMDQTSGWCSRFNLELLNETNS